MTSGSMPRSFLTAPNLPGRAITALTAAWVALATGSAFASPAAGHGEAAHGAAAGAHAPAAAHHHDGITLFNWPSAEDPRIGLAYLVINFVVLAFLIHRLILRKLIQDNATRHDEIKRQVDEAAAALREAQTVIADYKQRVARIEADSQQILDEARQAAAADRQRLQSEAETEVERFKAGALAAAQREVDTRKAELETEVVDRAIARAAEILQSRLTDSDHNRMVDDFAIDLASRPTAR
jgi:F-type H+-transporting ATPase subunit b